MQLLVFGGRILCKYASDSARSFLVGSLLSPIAFALISIVFLIRQQQLTSTTYNLSDPTTHEIETVVLILYTMGLRLSKVGALVQGHSPTGGVVDLGVEP